MITVLGASGFIGSHLVRHLAQSGLEHQAPARDELPEQLGHVIYCIGLTADFRERPYDAVEAHVAKLLEVVRHGRFESLLYLSSTRVYRRGGGREDDDLRVNPSQADDLYDLSKLTGEAVALSLPNGRVARLSNVYGEGQTDTFLASVLSEAKERGAVELRTALASAKDYVSVHDVVPLLVRIALHGRERIYNVASGVNVTHAELVAAIGCRATAQNGAPAVVFPAIDITRVRTEFGFTPARVTDALRSL